MMATYDKTTVEGYKKYCEAFHKGRLNAASSAWRKLLGIRPPEGSTIVEVSLTECEARIAAEALQYYMRN